MLPDPWICFLDNPTNAMFHHLLYPGYITDGSLRVRFGLLINVCPIVPCILIAMLYLKCIITGPMCALNIPRFSLTKVSEYMDVHIYPAKYDSFAISLYRDLSS